MISKKLLIINIAVMTMVFCTYISGIALLNYPWYMSFWNYVQWNDILYLLITLAFLALISWMISTLKIKNLTAKNRFLLVYSILCSFLVGYFMYISINSYLSAEEAIVQIENEYIQQAQKDIKNGRVIFSHAGGFAIPNEWDGKIDSIHQKYGIQYQNSGCIIEALEIKGQEKYKETVQPYLEKRNGKGWEEKMEKEIKMIKN